MAMRRMKAMKAMKASAMKMRMYTLALCYPLSFDSLRSLPFVCRDPSRVPVHTVLARALGPQRNALQTYWTNPLRFTRQ